MLDNHTSADDIRKFVKKGHMASPLKAAIQVEKKVYSATAHQLLQVSKATPNNMLCLFGPHVKNFDPSFSMIKTNMTLEMTVHMANNADRSLLSSKRRSQKEHITNDT
jgi:fumarylacetoacetate (FAA) hydrolase family protein